MQKPLKLTGLVLLVLVTGSTVLIATIPSNVRENIINYVRLKIELPFAMARWQVRGVDNYDIDVVSSPHPPCFGEQPVTFQIRNGTVMTVVESFGIQDDRVQWGWCGYKDFSVANQLRDLADVRFNPVADYPYIRVRFDAEFGYVTESESDAGMWDTYFHYTYGNFRPIEEDKAP